MNPRAQLIIDELARHRHQFDVFCRLLTADDLAALVPGSPWTVRDYIAHLGTIDGLIAHGFQRAAGLAFVAAPDIQVQQPFDIDDWNDAAVAARRTATVEQLLAEAAGHRRDLIEILSALDDAQLDQLVPFGSRRAAALPDVPVKLRSVLWAIAVHDPNHTQDMLRAIPHRAAMPFVREWLASARTSEIDPEISRRRA